MWRLPALGFEADWIRSLVSMAADSSHRLCMVKKLSTCFLCFFDWIFTILARKEDTYKS